MRVKVGAGVKGCFRDRGRLVIFIGLLNYQIACLLNYWNVVSHSKSPLVCRFDVWNKESILTKLSTITISNKHYTRGLDAVYAIG